MLKRALSTGLLPLGRRWPEGPDEGAFTRMDEVAPHQFGRMTYGCATKDEIAADVRHAAVSHGLTSSPPRGEGAAIATQFAQTS